MSRHGKLFIIAAPSGAGKTSLVEALARELPRLRISISYTTRSKRPGEEHGVQYYFIDEPEFEELVAQHDFLEHATVFGYHYGTGRRWVLEQLQQGIDVILEIDWQGARQIRERFKDAVSIFILPPSLASLKERLVSRGQDSEAVIAERLAKAKFELKHYKEFDYLVLNQTFAVALSDLKNIILARRLSLLSQQEELKDLLAQLLQTD